MASIVVPGLDLAPSVPSRIVTVDVIDMTEGRPAAGEHIDFILPQDLHARADGKVLKAGTTRLTLDSQGHGEIRVPAYSSDTKPADWVILVKKSWAPHAYPIRVAPGTTAVSLATLEPPVEVNDLMAKYLLTDASATIAEGAQWGVNVTTAGNVANFAFTAPPGGSSWQNAPTVASGTDLNTLNGVAQNGALLLAGGGSATYSNLPPSPTDPRPVALLFVTASPHGRDCWQRVIYRDSDYIYERVQTGVSSWSPWKDISAPPLVRHRTTLADGTDLNTCNTQLRNGVFQLSASGAYPNCPVSTAAELVVFASGNGDTFQRVVTRSGDTYERTQTGTSSWSGWAETTNPALRRRAGVLPAGTDLNTYNTLLRTGIWVLGSSSEYVNAPPRPTMETGMLTVITDGTGDTIQTLVWRDGQGVYQREQVNTSGRWTPWRDISRHALEAVDGRLATLEAAQSAPVTPHEASNGNVDPAGTRGWTSFWAGEAFLKRLGGRLETIGYTYNGRPITALIIGDTAKPTLLLQFGQHGSERAAREAAFMLARELTASTPTWINRMCVVIVPTINADNILVQRENDRGTDLNRDWDGPVSREVKALNAFYSTLNLVTAVDFHEHDRPQSSALMSAEPVAGASATVNARSMGLQTAMWSAVENAGFTAAQWENPSGLPEVFRNAAPVLYGAGTVLMETPGGGAHMLPPADRVAMVLAAANAAITYTASL